MQDQPNLPDNLKNKIARFHVANREFTDDSGKAVNYNRGVIQVLVKGEPFDIEFKIDKKDIAILNFADNVDQPAF